MRAAGARRVCQRTMSARQPGPSALRAVWEVAHKYLGWLALLGGVTNCALGAAVAAAKYESALSIGAAVVLGVGTAPVVCFGLYRCARGGGVPVEAKV